MAQRDLLAAWRSLNVTPETTYSRTLRTSMYVCILRFVSRMLLPFKEARVTWLHRAEFFDSVSLDSYGPAVPLGFTSIS